MSDESVDPAPAPHAFDPAAAFALLGDGTRLRILRELWEAQRGTLDEAVPFETLRERAGVDDSGRFNYHLGKLRGRFVERTDDGYRLRFAGARVVGALLEGTYAPGEDLDVPAGGECSDCEVGLRLRYADERVTIACPECDTLTSDFGCPPGVLAGRPAAALPGVVDTHLRTLLDRSRRGICPNCSGPTTVRVEAKGGTPDAVDPDEDEPTVRLSCDRCGDRITTGLPGLVVDRPAVVAFLHERGVDPEGEPLWVLLSALSPDSRSVSGDPYRASVTVHADGDALTLAVDDEGELLDAAET